MKSTPGRVSFPVRVGKPVSILTGEETLSGGVTRVIRALFSFSNLLHDQINSDKLLRFDFAQRDSHPKRKRRIVRIKT